MTLTVKHAFVSGIADDPTAAAAGEVLPQAHWNADHGVTGTVGPEIGARTILTANTNYYVTVTGSDSANGSLATPWATLTHALSFIGSNIDGGGAFYIIVNLGAGSFQGAAIREMTGITFLQITGAGTASTTLTAGPNDGVFNFGECLDNPIGYTPVAINNLKCASFGGSPAIANYQFGSQLAVGGDFTSLTAQAFAFDCTGASFCVLDAAPGFISDGGGGATAVVSVTGGGATLQAFAISEGNTLITLGNSYAVSGALAVTSGFLQAFNSGVFVIGNANANTITGAGVTGPRFISQDSSAIGGSAGTGTLGPTFLPGNANGIADAASTYDGFPGPLPGIDTQTGASYTLAIGDAFEIVEMNNAGANTLTVPTNASVAFEIGTKIWVTQIGAGATTIAGAGGVTVDNAGAVGGQWKSVKLYKRGTDEWVQTNA